MADYYVDSAGSNTSPYDTWAKAAPNIAAIVTHGLATSDVIHCRGTETLTTTAIDFATSFPNSVKVIGYNASGVEDGTHYVIDGDGSGSGTATSMIVLNADYLEFRNIKFTDGAGKGLNFSGASSDFCRLINVIVENCVGFGIDGLYANRLFCWNCLFTGNSYGYNSGFASAEFWNCSFINNDSYGAVPDAYSTFVNCLFFDHVNHIYNADSVRCVNCVFHKASGHSITGKSGAGQNIFMGCRFSLCGASSYHLQRGLDTFITVGCYFHDDGLGMVSDLSYLTQVGYNGTNTNESAGSDTDYGFVSISAGSEDFNLNSLASKRRQEFPVPGM